MTARIAKIVTILLALATVAVWLLVARNSLGAWFGRPAITFPGVLTDQSEMEAMAPALSHAGVGLGNTPIRQAVHLMSTMMYTDDKGCMGLKPNLQKTMLFLRTSLYEPLDPMTAFYDTNATLPADVRAFLDQYGFDPTTLSTDQNGDRVTVPLIDRPTKVLVAGDSMAFGAMLGDRDSLASRLQARDDKRQYVTISVPGRGGKDIVCNVERSLPRLTGHIDELIYYFTEDDFQPKEAYGTPEQIAEWLRKLARDEHIRKVTIIYAPFIYNVAPQFTRYAGYRGARIPNPAEEKARLRKLIGDAGFHWLDIGEIALKSSARYGSQFAVLANFVDHAHLSAYGMDNLVAAYLAQNDDLAHAAQ